MWVFAGARDRMKRMKPMVEKRQVAATQSSTQQTGSSVAKTCAHSRRLQPPTAVLIPQYLIVIPPNARYE